MRQTDSLAIPETRLDYSTRVTSTTAFPVSWYRTGRMEPLILVLAADENYAMPLAVTLFSALANLRPGSRAYVYIIDGGISPASKDRLLHLATLKHVDVYIAFLDAEPTQLDTYSLKVQTRLNKATFLRLLIPELIPEWIDRALYLDSDMVVEADLMRLWQVDIGDRAALAVRDLNIPYVSSRLGLYNWQELGLKPDTPYFNTGLLLLNLTRWRTNRIGRKILDYLTEHGDKLNLQHDQEGINAVLAGEAGQLDLRWNLISATFIKSVFERSEYKEEVRPIRRALIRNPYIIHFTASKKPWHPDCIHPARSRFFHYLRRSGWFSPSEYFRWRIYLLPRQVAAYWIHRAKNLLRPLRRPGTFSSAPRRAEIGSPPKSTT